MHSTTRTPPRRRMRWVAAVALVLPAMAVTPVAYSLSSDAPWLGQAGGGQSATFTISGNVSKPVWPGKLSPINLVFTNESGRALTVRNIKLHARSLVAPNATPEEPCTVSDFRIKQPAHGVIISVPANTRRSLKAAGIRGRKWPAAGLWDRATNQDGCKGATLTMDYSAVGV